ncbi:hypothetical protein ACHQM5_004988 [Ranunculus cassubicifolius]
MTDIADTQLWFREKNKRVKNNCVRKSTHNTRRYWYVRAEQNFKHANQGKNHVRVELWSYTQKKKGWGYVPDNVEVLFEEENKMVLKLLGRFCQAHFSNGMMTSYLVG